MNSTVCVRPKACKSITDACTGVGTQFTRAYDISKHARDITTDTGWSIVLSLGLDVFQRFELNDAFSFANRLQQHRQCKEFSVTFVRLDPAATPELFMATNQVAV